MGMSTEAAQDYKESLSLLSGEELRSQLGEDEEHDTIIQQVLDGGKAVELKAGAKPAGDEDDPSDPPGKAAAGDDDQDEDDPDDDPDADPGDDPADPPAVDAAAKQGEQGAEAAEAAEAAASAAEAAAVTDEVLPPPDMSAVDQRYKEGLAALDATKADKLAELMEGTMTPKDYAAFEAKYMADRDDLRDRKAAEVEWFGGVVHTFQSEALKATGINYVTDAAMGEALDDWVKRLSAKPGNEDKPPRWYLEEAHKKVMAEFDIAPRAAAKPPAAAGKPAAEPAKPAKPARTPKLADIPPTLGKLPAAAGAEGHDGGEFGKLDSLTGMAYERALAALSPDQKLRYEQEA